METLTNKRQHDDHKEILSNKRRRRSDSPPAAKHRWLILNCCIDDKGGDSSIADAKTTAACCTSSGKPFSISFSVAAPPACCTLHIDWLGSCTPGNNNNNGKHPKSEPDDVRIRVIAGHDDSVLIQMRTSVANPNVRSGLPTTTTFDDYFLYQAGGGAGPPSLSLLPGCYVPVQMGYRNHRDPTPRFRSLDTNNTGILRRDEDGDLLACQFERTCDPPVYDMAELCMLRIGRDREWIVRRLPIVDHGEGRSERQPWQRQQSLVAGAAVPVGKRFLCWVDYGTGGFIVCDMADEESPKLRYTLLPTTTQHDGYGDAAYWTLGAAGPNAVRFVSVSPPRCCRGDVPGKMSCKGSSSSFSVTTWTMTLSIEEATTWVKDVVLDCDEIWKWQLPGYGCLPRDKHLEYPMVSPDDPNVIYFKVEAMAVAIDMRSKKLVSVVHSSSTCRDLDEDDEEPHLITAKLRW